MKLHQIFDCPKIFYMVTTCSAAAGGRGGAFGHSTLPCGQTTGVLSWNNTPECFPQFQSPTPRSQLGAFRLLAADCAQCVLICVLVQVMEMMTGGELFDRIVAKEKYTEDEARVVVRKLATAIEYCHNMGIVHRDLKVRPLTCGTGC